MVDSQIKFT